MSAHDITAMNAIACGDIYPDLTIILDIDCHIGLERAKLRGNGKTVLNLKARPIMKK